MSKQPFKIRIALLWLLPLDDLILVAVELHAAERAALVEIADRIGLELGLLGKSVLAKILAAAGRAVAEVVGAAVVPPHALVIRGTVENFEVDVGMIEPDPTKLNQVLRFEPDREPAMIKRLVAEIADPDARNPKPVLIGIERAHRLAEHLADAVAAIGARRHIGSDPVMARVEADRMVRRGKHNALDALFARRFEQVGAASVIVMQAIVP